MAKKRLHPGLVALSASAIAAVYAVGYVHTQPVDAALAAASAPTPSVAAPATLPPAPAITANPIPSTSNNTGPATTTRRRRESDDGEFGESSGSSRGQRDFSFGSGAASGVISGRSGLAPQQPSTQSSAATTAPAAPAAPASSVPAAGYKDGTYTGAGTSRFGGVEVSVTVEGGKISNVALTRVTTKYPASRIAALPGQVVDRQSAQVNNVSGATASASAFRAAVQVALSKAQ